MYSYVLLYITASCRFANNYRYAANDRVLSCILLLGLLLLCSVDK